MDMRRMIRLVENFDIHLNGWYNPATGVAIEADNHADEVRRHPAAFGYDDHEDFSDKDRDDIRRDTIERGWVRIGMAETEDYAFLEAVSLPIVRKALAWLRSIYPSVAQVEIEIVHGDLVLLDDNGITLFLRTGVLPRRLA